MQVKSLILSLLMVLLVPFAAHAQRGGDSDNWELLGEQTVGFRTDNDSIVLNQGESWYRTRAFRALRFSAERNDVQLNSIRIIYINGHSEELRVNKLLRRGSELVVDLRGERSFLKQIDMNYKSNIGFSIGGGGAGIRFDQAVIKVYGERIQRRPERVEERPVAESSRGGWSVIETLRFKSGEDQVVFSSGRGDGRFGQIRLKAGGDPVRIRDMQIRFRNGETQIVRLDSRLEDGEETRAIDLTGETRFLDTVTVNLEPRRRPGRPELTLLGSRREGGSSGGGGGDPFASRGWTLLGEQTVGFTADRDVIEIRQNEDWYRDRRFSSLHLIALNNDIFMRSMRVEYINGQSEVFNLDRLLAAGTDTEIDMRGERSYIRRIELNYRSRPSFRGQAVMRVYGEAARRR
jgi:hypothetical protein